MPPGTVRSREKEWRAIQGRLRELLFCYGRNAPQGDYYLIAEDSGTYEQKVLVFFRDVVAPELLEAIENLLLGYSRKWRVLMLAANKDGTEVTPPTGLKVWLLG